MLPNFNGFLAEAWLTVMSWKLVLIQHSGVTPHTHLRKRPSNLLGCGVQTPMSRAHRLLHARRVQRPAV
jgi:hypothetical protein